MTQDAQSPAQAPVRGGVAHGVGSSDASPTLPPIPIDGGQVVVDRRGNRTIVTSAAIPPGLMVLTQRVEETAFGLMGLLAVIIIVGPFARMFARRMEKRAELNPAGGNQQILQHQLEQLQQSVDAMSLEVERISESQRFQSKLLHEKRSVTQ